MKINIGKWLKRQVFGGDPVTISSVSDLLAAIRSDTVIKEGIEAKVKREIVLGMDLETVQKTLIEFAPQHKQQIAGIVSRIQDAILDWQL